MGTLDRLLARGRRNGAGYGAGRGTSPVRGPSRR